MTTPSEMLKDGVTAVSKAFGFTDPLLKRLKNEKEAETPVSELPEHATQLLVLQHREVDGLFAQIADAGEKAVKTKEQLLATLITKLQHHTEIEEMIFYPAAKAADKKLVLEAYEEHANVKSMLQKLSGLSASDETFQAKVTVLKELVHHHVGEEEKTLFPECETVLGEDTLQTLGAQMIQKLQDLERGGARKKQAASKAKKAAPKMTAKKPMRAKAAGKKTMGHASKLVKGSGSKKAAGKKSTPKTRH